MPEPRETSSAASTHSEEMQADRVEELEEAIRNILDVVAGWTRPMTDGEKFRAIKKIGYGALGIAEDE